MTFRPHPVHYTKDEFASYVDSLSFDKWRPTFGVHHCTGVPDLKMWTSGGPTPQQRIENMANYWRKLGWHSAPQLVSEIEYIFEPCYLNQDGVHCSCSGANSHSIGMETVGSYETDLWDSGPGAKVKANAIWTWAVIHKKLGWDPELKTPWKSGLMFHSDCKKDGHTGCPGKHVIRADLVRDIRQTMEKLGAMKKAPATIPPLVSVGPVDVEWMQNALNRAGASLPLPLLIDGKIGPKTKAAIRSFKQANGLGASDVIDSTTIAKLKAILPLPGAKP